MAFTLRPSVDSQERWEAAAAGEGRSLASWIGRVCDEAAGVRETAPEFRHLDDEMRPRVLPGEVVVEKRPEVGFSGPLMKAVEAAPVPVVRASALPQRELDRRTKVCEHRVPPGSFCKKCASRVE